MRWRLTEGWRGERVAEGSKRGERDLERGEEEREVQEGQKSQGRGEN